MIYSHMHICSYSYIQAFPTQQMCKVMSVYMIYVHLDPEIYIKVQVLTDQTLSNTHLFF